MRRVLLCAWAAVAMTAAGCDEDDPCAGSTALTCTTAPSPTPAPVVRRTTVVERGDGSLPAFNALFRSIPTGELGTLEAEVDWTHPHDDLDVAIARGTCQFDSLISGHCVLLNVGSSPTAKPERARIVNEPPGNFTVIIVNFGPDDESISYQVRFTNGAGSSSAAAATTTAAFAGKDLRRLRRALTVE